MQPVSPGRGVRVMAAIAVITLIGSGAAPASAAQPGDPSDSGATIAPQLESRLQADGEADFWVRFGDHADLAAAGRIGDWDQRGREVARALRETAQTSQAAVRARLDAAGAPYQAFWATNAIRVSSGSDQLAAELAALPGVDSLLPTTTYEVPAEPAEEAPVQPGADAVEWNVANINADQVWSQYGTRGAGITVANIDTGVQYDHPTLVNRYRGNQGDGTFGHDYHWFDAAGRCPDAPCDTNGHGTHTMGTMVGDDGGDNRIGVAPEVTWIAANGCCPDDAALIASGQWMLEPTDLAGENPDASKRPHVINNSWGSRYPSNDPFLEDIATAWAASGIFAAWSNGNSGPACRTSGAPGSRTVNYSVGAYGPDGTIAAFSARGGGQDGGIKPDISAPGVGVRSAFPGNGYAVADGTSMAAPHVAAAVALLWSAAPDLVGDVDAARARLDGTAVDTPDAQCGGSPGDNNVYGEGRLDALGLLDTAPVAGTGTLAVTVTDASDGGPVAAAAIGVAGPVQRHRVSGADGSYALPLPPGSYSVTVSAFGYADHATQVSVAAGGTTTVQVGLTPLAAVTVKGQVTDGSGQGWPLYAAVGVAGRPDRTVHTDPETGRYRLTLPAGGTYTLTVQPRYEGYLTVSDEIDVGSHSLTHDVAVPVNGDSCLDLGYEHAFDGHAESFDDEVLPDGWTVVDHNGSTHGWRFDDPNNRGNLTGGEGGFAVTARSPGVFGELDSSLVSPVFDLSAHPDPILLFRQDYLPLRDTAQVDLSLDGGATWETLLEQASSMRGPAQEVVPIPQAAGQPQVRVRFHLFGNTLTSRFWQVDDVFVGTRTCEPLPAGMVVGHVRDRNTGEPVNGATVTGEDEPQLSTRSVATPGDPALEDGFYWLVSARTGSTGFTATADSYAPDTRRGDLGAGHPVTRRDFDLPAGRLAVAPDTLSGSVAEGGTTEVTVVVTNTGSAPAQVELRERDTTYEIPRAHGMVRSGSHVVRVPGEFSPSASGGFSPSASGSPSAPGGDHAPASHGRATGEWVDLPDYPTRVMDSAVGELDGKIYSVGGMVDDAPLDVGYVYDPADGTWSRIADLPEPLQAAAGAAIDGKFYVAGGWPPLSQGSRALYVYDPQTDTWSSGADAPFIFAAAGRAVLDGQLYVIGGCSNNCFLDRVHRYHPASDSWQELARYPVLASHLACAGIAGQVICTGGTRAGGVTWNRTYAYDPVTDTWTRQADLPIQLWGMSYTASSDRLIVSGGVTGGATDIGTGAPVNPTALTNEGFVYDPATDSWSGLPPAGHPTYRAGNTCGLVKIGGTMVVGFAPVDTVELLPTYADCVPADVPWLSLDAGPVTLKPGQKVRVTVTLQAAGALPGSYRAGIWIKEDTPYLAYPLDVAMAVTPATNGASPR